MDNFTICQQSATDLARYIRGGEITAETVVSAFLQKAAQVQDQYLPFVEITPDIQRDQSLLEQARAIDIARLAGGKLGPLAGVPITVKDWLQVQGHVSGTSFGAPLAQLSVGDATVVARMRAAGALVLAKTRAAGSADKSPGPFNPRNVAHSCGASSSGEAAAIAASASPLGLGSDSGGSIRWPAHCTGVFGLKPTQGRVPLTGHVPPIIALTDPRTVIGPLANCVADLELALQIIHGPDGFDASALPVPLVTESGTKSLADCSVAMIRGFDGAEADTQTLKVLDEAVARLRERGASVVEAVPEFIEDAYAITLNYWQRPESISWEEWQPAGASTLDLVTVEEQLFRWDRLSRSLAQFMQRFDLIVCPVATQSAPELRAAVGQDYVFTLPFSLTGQPVVVAPIGTAVSGMPIGVQVVAQKFNESLAFSGAKVVAGESLPGKAG